MRCDACKAPISDDSVVRCKCGATFCNEVTRAEHRDAVTGDVVRQRFKCADLHHCGAGLTSAIEGLERAHGRMKR